MKLNPSQAAAFINAYRPVYATFPLDGATRRIRVARITRNRNGFLTLKSAAGKTICLPAERITLDNGSQM